MIIARHYMHLEQIHLACADDIHIAYADDL